MRGSTIRREIRLSYRERKLRKNAEITQAQKEIQSWFPSFIRGRKTRDTEIDDTKLSAELSWVTAVAFDVARTVTVN
jgi:hypothetical protein